MSEGEEEKDNKRNERERLYYKMCVCVVFKITSVVLFIEKKIWINNLIFPFYTFKHFSFYTRPVQFNEQHT